MRVFVTGATGLLGGNLVQLLAHQGHQVTAVVRSKKRAAQQLQGLSVELIEGDMENVAAFAKQLAGHEVVYHCAAYFREYYQPGDHWAKLKAVNVDGTLALLRAAEAQGVSKLVYASSSGVLGKGAPADEQTPPDALVHANLYFRSKLQAEEAVGSFLQTSSLPVVLILPGWMFGPGDWAPTSSGRIVLDLLNRQLPIGIPGHGAPVDARDVAATMITAAERGRSGERYVVGGPPPVSFRTIFGLIEELSGVPTPRFFAPLWFAYAYAFASESYGRLSRTPVTATIEGVNTLAEPRPLSSVKAIRELGASFRPLRDTLRDEIAWFRAERPELLKPAALRPAGV